MRIELLCFDGCPSYEALARGPTREGRKAMEGRAVDFVRTHAVTCGLEEHTTDVRLLNFVIRDRYYLLTRENRLRR